MAGRFLAACDAFARFRIALLVAGGILAGSSGLLNAVPALAAGGTWAATGSMATARTYHTATLLPSGKVLVAGGYNGSILASAELYNAGAGTWSATSAMASARYSYTATLLPSGKVLVAGGIGFASAAAAQGYLALAELYDPQTGTWSATGSMATGRWGHTATLLPSGKVLVAGGGDNNLNYLTSAELYDPLTGTWSGTGSLVTGRVNHTGNLLPSGKVLVAGGANVGGKLASAELYDPVTGTWSATRSMTTARTDHTATLLPSGKVLVAGGNGATDSELYDPVTGAWSGTGFMTTDRFFHTANLLPSGKVLVAGGFGSAGTLPSAELYDPLAGAWSGTGSMATGRYNHTATLLASCEVLVTGGFSNANIVASAELYTPETLSPASVTLSPSSAVNNVGTSHTVTATVKDANSCPVQSVVVLFNVQGADNVSGSCTTDSNGQCSFTYQGPNLPGADVITGCADSNGNGSVDAGEPCGEATKAWLAPTSTPGQTTGGGQIVNTAGAGQIAFGFTAKSDQNGVKGECTVVDPAGPSNTRIKCLDVTALVLSATHATFFGDATVNGTATTYRIDVDDFAEPGAGKDTFKIQTASGYSASGILTAGNIQVHN